MALATMVTLKNCNTTGIKTSILAWLKYLIKSSVHFPPTFRTPYTPIKYNTYPYRLHTTELKLFPYSVLSF